MKNFKLTILGSSGALPAYGRFPSCQHLDIQHHRILIDCGEGAQFQMARFGLSIQKISHIIISHLHGDHYLGLTGLLFSMHLQRRENDLHLYSLRGLEDILLAQLKNARSVLNFKIVFHALREDQAGTILENEFISVETFPLDHKTPTQGFLFREKPKQRRINKSKLKEGMHLQHMAQLKRGEDVLDDNQEILYRSDEFTMEPRRSFSYAYCSDTQPNENILKFIRDVDLLYHEATFMDDDKVKARETKHSTAADAAHTALLAHAGKLIIGHFSARYRDLAPVLAEALKIFPDTVLATEGETFELTD